jgi:Putative zinc-finger
MNHPHEQLADLVDGTLDEGSLAGVQAHLETCAECRADVEVARRGRLAARSLPAAEPPTDLHERVAAAAGAGRGEAPRWYRWAGAAAAVAVVLAVAIALPEVGNDRREMSAVGDAVASDGSAGGAAEDAGANPSAARVPLTRQDLDYDQSALQDLAAGGRRAFGAVTSEDSSGVAVLSGTEDAARCVGDAFDGQPTGLLTQMIQARFDGRDAYIAVYLEGPGAGQPADTVAVYAASRDDCRLLSFASARI